MVNGPPPAVLRLAACRAVLAGDVPPALAAAPGVVRVELREARRTVSPAASYAVDAVGALGVSLGAAAVFTFAGPPGSPLHLFDPARSEVDGRLVSPGFGTERSRRIHPFLLLVSLQNQVAATLSLHYGLRGPCCSTTDSAAAFADLLPNLALQTSTRPVVAVFASAAARAEQRSRGVYETGAGAVVEGAVALFFTARGALGCVAAGGSATSDARSGWSDGRGSDRIARDRSGECGEPGLGMPSPFAPVLEPGLSLLRALADRVASARIEIHEPGRTTAFHWARSH